MQPQQMFVPVLQSDYCIRIDREWSIDGCARAKDTSRFSPCHMNHSSSRNNVVRSTSRRDKRVSFFAAQDIKVTHHCQWVLLNSFPSSPHQQ